MNDNFENNEMFQKLSEGLKEFFQQLPEETKEKILNCKSEEEAMDVLKGDMIPLPMMFWKMWPVEIVIYIVRNMSLIVWGIKNVHIK